MQADANPVVGPEAGALAPVVDSRVPFIKVTAAKYRVSHLLIYPHPAIRFLIHTIKKRQACQVTNGEGGFNLPQISASRVGYGPAAIARLDFVKAPAAGNHAGLNG